MKNIFILIVSTLLLSSCNKAISEYCSKKYAPDYEECKFNCKSALPEPGSGQSVEDAIKACEDYCKNKYFEDKLNCRLEVDTKCIRKCTKRMAKECKRQKRNCIRNARITKRNCKSNCTGRRRQRRICKRNCNRTFRTAKRNCKNVDCSKSIFLEDCVIECL